MASKKDEQQQTAGEALTPVSTEYPVLAAGSSRSLEIIGAHLDPDDMSQFTLPRIKIVPGGGNAFQIQTKEGKAETRESFEGIILMRRKMRAYFPDGQPLGGTPPACYSDNGHDGYGDITGGKEPPRARSCKNCPLAQFGSIVRQGKPGRGQACAVRNVLFVLNPGYGLPHVLSAPPTSAKAVQQFIMSLAAGERNPFEVVTHFSLQTMKNAEQQPFSQLVLNKAAELSPNEAKVTTALFKELRRLFGTSRMSEEQVASFVTEAEAEPQDE